MANVIVDTLKRPIWRTSFSIDLPSIEICLAGEEQFPNLWSKNAGGLHQPLNEMKDLKVDPVPSDFCD
jgi:hypothetical protein